MLPNTFGCNSLSRRIRALIRRVSSDEVSFSTLHLGLAESKLPSIMVRATSNHTGNEIGRVVTLTSPVTETCYVIDVIIHDQKYTRIGLAEELIKRAFGLKTAKEISPVNIESDAVCFWAYLAKNSSLPIRLGLISKEIDCQKSFLKS